MAETLSLEQIEEENRRRQKPANYSTGQLVWGLLTGATLIGGVVVNHYFVDYQSITNKTSLWAIGGEAAAYLSCYLGYALSRSRNPSRPSGRLESKISMN